MATLVIRHIDDEHIEFLLDDSEIVSVNHDEDGWVGMATVQEALERVAELEGWDVMLTHAEEEE